MKSTDRRKKLQTEHLQIMVRIGEVTRKRRPPDPDDVRRIRELQRILGSEEIPLDEIEPEERSQS